MATDEPNQLAQFHQFVGEQLARGVEISPQDALALWSEAHPTDDDDEDDIVAAVQEALDDMAAGDTGVPLDEFDREFRRRHNLK